MGKPCPDPSILTREFLYQAYCVEKRGILSIAREVKCRNGVIVELLNEYGFSQKSQNPTKEWLVEHYVTLQEDLGEIATQLGRTEENVRYHMRNFGIPIHKRGKPRVTFLNDREWLYDHYVTKRYSLHTIADLAHCRVSSVVRALTRLNIIRPEDVRGLTGVSRRRQFVYGNRKLILERDEQRCRYPGCGSTEHLELHHIVPIAQGGLDSVDNGITLCRKHHRSIAARETEYIPLFLSIINQPSVKQTGAARSVSTATQLRLFA